MSVEILKQGTVYKLHEDTAMNDWCHDAIHDIESLFWVITYICLIREGPGKNMLRKELQNDDPESKDLQGVIYRYFDISDSHLIFANKQALFDNHNQMDNDILLQFHPYFEPLKRMMIQWWRVMILAYEYRKFEYYTIHDEVIHIVGKAMEELSENQDPRTATEEKRRLDEREKCLASVQGEKMEPSGEHKSPERLPFHAVFDEPTPQEPGSPLSHKSKRLRRGG